MRSNKDMANKSRNKVFKCFDIFAEFKMDKTYSDPHTMNNLIIFA